MAITLNNSGWSYSNSGFPQALFITGSQSFVNGSTVVVYAGGAGGDYAVNITDNQSNTYNQLYNLEVQGYRGRYYVATGITGGILTLTASYNQNFSYPRACFAEFSGSIGLGHHTASNNGGATGGSGTDAATSGTFVPSGSNSTLCGILQTVNDIPTITAGTDFTEILHPSPIAELFAEYRSVSGQPGTVATTWTFNANNYYMALGIELLNAGVSSASYSGIGGAVSGYSADKKYGRVYAGLSGGIAGASGTIAFTKTISFSGIGGSVAGGAGVVAFTRNLSISAIGGSVVGGEAVRKRTADYGHRAEFFDNFNRGIDLPNTGWDSGSGWIISNNRAVGIGTYGFAVNSSTFSSGQDIFVDWKNPTDLSNQGVLLYFPPAGGSCYYVGLNKVGNIYSASLYRNIEGVGSVSVGSWGGVHSGSYPQCRVHAQKGNGIVVQLFVNDSYKGALNWFVTPANGYAGLYHTGSGFSIDDFSFGFPGEDGGGVTGGEAILTYTYTFPYVAIGGAVIGGSSGLLYSYLPVSTDGGVAGGGSLYDYGRTYLGTSGAIAGGETSYSFTSGPQIVMDGGAVAGSSAGHSSGFLYTMLGGAIGGAENVVLYGAIYTPTLGAVAGGEVLSVRNSSPEVVGGGVVGGEADVVATGLQTISITMSGGVVTGASSSLAFGVIPETSGGSVVGYENAVAYGAVFTSTAGAVIAGAIDNSFGFSPAVEAGGIAGGESAHSYENIIVAGGGSVGGGEATVEAINLQIFEATMVGGGIVGGEATFQGINLQIFETSMSGGAVIGGAVENSFERIYTFGQGSIAGGSGTTLFGRAVAGIGGGIAGGSALMFGNTRDSATTGRGVELARRVFGSYRTDKVFGVELDERKFGAYNDNFRTW